MGPPTTIPVVDLYTGMHVEHQKGLKRKQIVKEQHTIMTFRVPIPQDHPGHTGNYDYQQ